MDEWLEAANDLNKSCGFKFPVDKIKRAFDEIQAEFNDSNFMVEDMNANFDEPSAPEPVFYDPADAYKNVKDKEDKYNGFNDQLFGSKIQRRIIGEDDSFDDEIINTKNKGDKIILRGGDKGINLDEYTTYNLGDGIIRNDKGDEINVNDILPENDNEPAVHYRDILHDSSVREDLKARSFGNIGSTAEHTRLKEAFEAYRRSYVEINEDNIINLR